MFKFKWFDITIFTKKNIKKLPNQFAFKEIFNLTSWMFFQTDFQRANEGCCLDENWFLSHDRIIRRKR